jgi:hypothetical protein
MGAGKKDTPANIRCLLKVDSTEASRSDAGRHASAARTRVACRTARAAGGGSNDCRSISYELPRFQSTPFPINPMLRTFILTIGITVLLVSGCGEPVDRPPAGQTATNSEAICLQGEAFVESGALTVETPSRGDAARVAGLRWEPHEGCERFVIDLATNGGDPASTSGQIDAEVLRDIGVVRISMRGVETVDSDATDTTFTGPLARAAYAVFSPGGRWVYVDVHLGEAAEAFVQVLDDPARVVVDLRPGGQPVPEPPATHSHVVVLEPREGESTYPLTVTGYARTFEANVVARIEQDGETVEETFTTATAWADAWGHYAITFQDGPSGAITLHVGEHSAKDGTWEGVEIPLDMR